MLKKAEKGTRTSLFFNVLTVPRDATDHLDVIASTGCSFARLQSAGMEAQHTSPVYERHSCETRYK